MLSRRGEILHVGDKVSLRESITGSVSQTRMLLIRRRKSSRASDDRGSLREHYIRGEHAPHPFSILLSVFLPATSMFMYVRLITESGDCSYSTPGGDNSKIFEGHARKYSPLSYIRASFFLFLRYFLIFPSLLATIRVIHALSPLSPDATHTHEQVLYPRDGFSFLRLISILKTLPLRGLSFDRALMRPRYPPLRCFRNPLSPFFACLRITGLISIPLSSFALAWNLVRAYREKINFYPVCSVVNGSPRGRGSARYSRNKEILSSGLYSTLCLSSQGNHYRYYSSEFLTFCSSQCV